MADRYDLIVVGAGPGGYVAAIRAAQLGMSVGLVEKRSALGGTCLNIGCIPSKALLDSSERFVDARQNLKRHGVLAKGVTLDLSILMKRKTQVVKQLTGGVAFLMKSNGVDVIQGIGRIVMAGQVEVSTDAGKTVLAADRILIATGSESIELPSFAFDDDRILSSTEALAFEEIPKELVVVGAGAIGLELGSVWSRLGSKVTVIELLPEILPGWDREIAVALRKELTKQGLIFELATRVESHETGKTGVIVRAQRLEGGETVHVGGDRVLVCVGRRPHTEGLGLAEVGIAMDGSRVQVNHRFETNITGIFAIGDVIKGPMLAHKAEEEGIAAVEFMAGRGGHVNYETIPAVVYTHPEASSVGKTEEQLQETGIRYKKGSFQFRANGRALAMADTTGFVKILAHEDTDRILGLHILGPHSSNLIAEAVAIMEFGGSGEDLARMVHAHPTLPEAVREAALALDGRSLHGG